MTDKPERRVLDYFEGLHHLDVRKLRDEVMKTLERTRAEIDRQRETESLARNQRAEDIKE